HEVGRNFLRDQLHRRHRDGRSFRRDPQCIPLSVPCSDRFVSCDVWGRALVARCASRATAVAGKERQGRGWAARSSDRVPHAITRASARRLFARQGYAATLSGWNSTAYEEWLVETILERLFGHGAAALARTSSATGITGSPDA